MLGLTVVLFSAIFAFVTRFPSPPAQSVNQFQATLVSSSSGVSQLKILQSGGPIVSPYDKVYLVASRTVTNWQFSQASGIPIAWGTGNSTKGWGTGQYWTTTFNPKLPIPTNITIYILSTNSLLFSTTVPGTIPSAPSVVTSTYTNPVKPAAGKAFGIFAVVSGTGTNLAFNVTLSQVPGLSGLGTPSMAYNASAAAWYYHVPAGLTTTNGSYLVFIQGVNTVTHVLVSGSLLITIGGSSGGGGGSSGLSVVVGMSVQPPPAPPTSAFFWAAVTYSGSSTGAVNVTFWVNETATGGHFPGKATSTKFYGSATTAIKGPGTVTIYSSSQFPLSSAGQAWRFGSSVVVQAYALASAGISGHAVGTTTFTTPASVSGSVCTTSSTTSCSSPTSSFTHYGGGGGCTTSSCPYLVVSVTNGLSSSVYASGVSVSGSVYVNASGHNYGPYTVATFTVAASSTSGEAASTGMPNNRWLVSNTGTYTVLALLTVSSGGVPIGYIYATFTVTVH